MRLPRPVVEKARDRILTAKEAGGLWNALQEVRGGDGVIYPVYGDLLSLLLLTGARCSEITRRVAGDLDLKAGTLMIGEGKTDASRRIAAADPSGAHHPRAGCQGKEDGRTPLSAAEEPAGWCRATR